MSRYLIFIKAKPLLLPTQKGLVKRVCKKAGLPWQMGIALLTPAVKALWHFVADPD